MSNEQQSIGMMEGAFFVPKSDLLNWINESLNLNITKIEQLGTGAVYCQIIDMMFPGRVNLAKVNWKARNQWEFISNLKILQMSFSKCKISKYIDIQRLSKSKYQDNLEFIQWLKRYYDLYNKNELASYDPVAARKGVDIDFSFVEIRSHPLKREKEQAKLKAKSRSPYDNIKARIASNKSATLEKHHPSQQNAEYYKRKLNKIKQILQKGPIKEIEKLTKITEIIEEIKEEIPSPTIEHLETEIQRIDTVPSKKQISQKSLVMKEAKKEPKKETKVRTKVPK